MQKELESKLIAEFPSFFRDIYGDPRKTSMARGIECLDGWYDLIFETCTKIKNYCEDHPECDFYFAQIKEKFAVLTIFSNEPQNHVIESILDNVAEQSGFVCEQCGSKENVEIHDFVGCIMTRCDKCIKPKDKIDKSC